MIILDDELVGYIEQNIFPEYAKNETGHGIEHIKYVIDRSLRFAQLVENIDYNMVYTIASYHDIGHHIDAKNHEKVSSKILYNDDNLRNFFDEEQMKVMSEAVFDHRASLEGEPRSIYGKIVSSADRNVTVDTVLVRTYNYRREHNPNFSIEQIMGDSLRHVLHKYINPGYAVGKMYFKDEEYEHFLDEISSLAKDEEAFRRRFLSVNNIHSDATDNA